MKKLIAISVVFALLTGAAFAQVSIGVDASAGATLVWGETNHVYGSYMEAGADPEKDAKPTKIEAPLATAGYLDGADEDFQWKATLKFSYETDGAEAGVSFVVDKDDLFDAINAWWFVVPQLKLGLGDAADFGRGDVTDFHYSEGSGNWFAISIIPMDMFSLNISFLDKGGSGLYDDGDDTISIGSDPVGGVGSGSYTGRASYMYADVFMVQAVVNIPGDLGQLALTYDNQYYYEDGFAKSGKHFRGMGFFLDYGVTDLMGFGVNLDFGFHFLNGSKDYFGVVYQDDHTVASQFKNPWGGYYVGGVWNPDPNDQIWGDKYSKWGVGFKVGYNIMGIDLGLSFGMSQETIDIRMAEVADRAYPKTYGMVMDLGFSVGYTMDLGMFDLALGASLDLLNLTSTDYYYQRESEYISAGERGSENPADYVKGYMAFEYEFDISLIKNIGGFTFTGGFNLFGSNAERPAYVDPSLPAPEKKEFESSYVRYKVPILFSYSW